MKTPDRPSQAALTAIKRSPTAAPREASLRGPSHFEPVSQAQRTLVQISRQSGIGHPSTCACVLSLLTASRLVREALPALMGESAISEGGLAALIMLYALDPVPSTAADLAYHAQVSRASMTQILDLLERRGHLTRARRSGDRRRHYIHLTDEGRAAAVAASQQFLRAADDLARGFSAKQTGALISACRRLIKRAARVRS